MHSLPSLLTVDPARTILSTELDDRELRAAHLAWEAQGLTVRVVRGRKMPRIQGLLDEFGAALQFPYYFGEKLGRAR